MSAEIIVNLYGGLEKYSLEGKIKDNRIKASKVNNIEEVLQHFSIPPDEANIILLDGHHVDLSDSVKAGNVISIFPLIGGG